MPMSDLWEKNKRLRERCEKRRLKGLCTQCGKKANGYRLCTEHRERINGLTRRFYWKTKSFERRYGKIGVGKGSNNNYDSYE